MERRERHQARLLHRLNLAVCVNRHGQGLVLWALHLFSRMAYQVLGQSSLLIEKNDIQTPYFVDPANVSSQPHLS